MEFSITEYTASEGKVFDWKKPKYALYATDPINPLNNVEREQLHLYAKTIYLNQLDSLDNYIEVDAP